jgi:peptide/nickel transport system substrate-binding protein
MVIDRQRINDIVFGGEAIPAPYGLQIMHYHPFFPEDIDYFTDPPHDGNVEGARTLLEDAGWEWDSDGNLHYPADADLEPLWPEGGSPDPANYECLNEDGEYVPPWNR